jgi:hypothetical protein
MIIYFPTPKIKLLHRGKWTHEANRPPNGSAGARIASKVIFNVQVTVIFEPCVSTLMVSVGTSLIAL